MTTYTGRWAVIETDGRRRMLRLEIHGVPQNVTRVAVQAVLENAGYGARFSVAGVPWGNRYQVRPQHRWPDSFDFGGRRSEVTWEALKAPAGRKISWNVSAALHSAVTLRAEHMGLTLEQFVTKALEAELGREEVIA